MKNYGLLRNKLFALTLAILLFTSLCIPLVKNILAEEASDPIIKIYYDDEKYYNDEEDYVNRVSLGDDGSYEGDVIYYSDGYFKHKSTEYDEHLATLSMFMAKFSMNKGSPTDEKDPDQWHRDQPKRLKGFMDCINFTDFETNDDYKSETGAETIGIGAARKTVGDSTVIAVTVRSGGYFLEWAGNVLLGNGSDTDYMHKGWYDAAKKVITFTKNYIKSKSINGKVKLWIAGFSRGGAVMNITGGLLDNDIKNNKLQKTLGNISLAHDDLFVYTFETPQGANLNSKTVEKPRNSLYNNIFNIINPNDLVPKVAMSEWGFTRFGIDKFITTKFFDKENIVENRKVFKAFYESYEDKNNPYKADDSIKMYKVPVIEIANALKSPGSFIGTMIGGGLSKLIFGSAFTVEDDAKKNYDSNVIMIKVLEEAVKEVGSRDNYVDRFQKSAMYIMEHVMGEISTKNWEIGDIVWLVIDQILEIGNNSPSSPDLSGKEDVDTKRFLSVFISMMFEVPDELLGLMDAFGTVYQNHDTNVCLAHMKAQDEYYIDAYNQEHSTSYKVVQLMKDASFRRITFDGLNDITMNSYSGGTKYEALRVEGHFFGSSDINKCDDDIAFGYYSYAFNEALEVFFPVNKKYELYAKAYVKKPAHSIGMKGYIYKSNSTNYDNYIRETLFDDSAWSYWWNMKVLSKTLDKVGG